MAIKHTFVSAKSDGADTSMVRPSDWNADHTIDDASITYAKLQNVSATDRLLGRSSSGAGVVQEITCTAAGRALIDDADAAAQRTTLGLGTLATQSGTFSGTSSGTNTGDQLVFKTISVSGQSDVVADTTTDTVTLAASGNLSITTNASTDTVTFTGTEPTQAFIIPCSDETTALTTGTAKATFRMPYGFQLAEVRSSLTTAQASGSIFTSDINQDGTTFLSTKLTVDNTEKTSRTAAAPPVMSNTSLANDAEISIDIDQVGDGTAKGLKVYLVGRRFSGLLDAYSGAAAAYSVRRLNSYYGGAALRVRRDNDNTEQDIGFDSSGNLDESALTTFVGANSGYVTKWYDQSGNGRHAEQTTSANQPRIVNAGTVDKLGGKPTMYLDGSNDFLGTTYAYAGTGFTGFLACGALGSANSDAMGFAHNAYWELGRASEDNFGLSVAVSAVGVVTTSPSLAGYYSLNASWANGGKYICSGNWNGNVTPVKARRNGVDATQSANTGSTIRTGTGSFDYYKGYASEMVLFASDRWNDRSAIESDINNYYSIY